MTIAQDILYPTAAGIEGVTPPGARLTESDLQGRQRDFAVAWDQTSHEDRDNILQLYSDGTRLTGEEIVDAPQEQRDAMQNLVARANRAGDRRMNSDMSPASPVLEGIPAGGGAPPADWPE